MSKAVRVPEAMWPRLPNPVRLGIGALKKMGLSDIRVGDGRESLMVGHQMADYHILSVMGRKDGHVLSLFWRRGEKNDGTTIWKADTAWFHTRGEGFEVLDHKQAKGKMKDA